MGLGYVLKVVLINFAVEGDTPEKSIVPKFLHLMTAGVIFPFSQV